MAYTLTGKLIKKYRGGMPKATLAAMLGVQYRGLVDKLEDGSRRAPREIEIKLLKFLNIPVEQYAKALIDDASEEVLESLGLNEDVETEVAKEDEWKDLI